MLDNTKLERCKVVSSKGQMLLRPATNSAPDLRSETVSSQWFYDSTFLVVVDSQFNQMGPW